MEESNKIFRYRIILTKKEVDQIKNRKIDIYESNGQHLFELRDNRGNKTGECALYVTFT